MSADPSPTLAAVLARVEAPAPSEAPSPELPDHVTGELRTLLDWWAGLAGARDVVAVEVDCTAGHDAVTALDQGVSAADRAIDAGATLLVPRVRDRDDEVARTIIALLTRREASAVVHQPGGMTDRAWMTRCAAIRDRAATATELRGEPVGLLAALPAPAIAMAVGVLLEAAARRTPCLVDGTDELAAALVADRLAYRAKGWWRAGSTSPDPGRVAAMDRVDLTPGLPLALADDAGSGADATIALLERLAPPVTP